MISISWSRIARWFRDNTPAGQYVFHPAASLPDIEAAERTIGFKLPDDVRESYLLYNGTKGWVLVVGLFLPLKELVEGWYFFSEAVKQGYMDGPDFVSKPHGPIKADWFNFRWVPISTNEEGDYTFIDMDPAQGGDVGQVIEFTRDYGVMKVLARSFGDWVTQLADDLEAGKYRYDPANGGDIKPVGPIAGAEGSPQ